MSPQIGSHFWISRTAQSGMTGILKVLFYEDKEADEMALQEMLSASINFPNTE